MRAGLHAVWTDWRIGVVVVLVLAAGAGLLCAWLTPRGPITTGQALASMMGALLVGITAGLVMGSRWSMLLTPVAFILVFELARLGVVGPTVDGIHLGSTYGVIAFVLGRGLQAVLVLAPMALGSLYGVWFAARLGREATVGMNYVGWTLTALASVALIVVALVIARPARTPPITGPDGETLPGSIAEMIKVPIGGHEQALMIRGRDVDLPVLLYLAGGPGGTDLGAMRADVSLEQYFVVATWEQRGAGKSYAALDPIETLTLEQMVADTIEVSNYLRQRFDEEKIYIMGNSWGTTLAVLAAQARPDLYYAYVGTGQMVSQRETDILFYEDTLAWAEETGNDKLVDALRQQGPPPYADLLEYEPAISHEHDWNPYPELDMSKEMPANLFVPENTFMDQVNGLRSFLDTFSVLYPQLQDIDFRKDVPSLSLPVYVVIGEYEARGRAVLAQAWFEALDAPSKQWIVFEHSGHRPSFEQPGEFASLMARVLAETYPGFTQASD